MSIRFENSNRLSGHAAALVARGWAEAFAAGKADETPNFRPEHASVLAVATDNADFPVGALCYFCDGFGNVFVQQAYVEEQFRGQGVFRGMIDHLAGYAAMNGFGRLRMIVSTADKRGAAVAQKVGMVPAATSFERDLSPERALADASAHGSVS